MVIGGRRSNECLGTVVILIVCCAASLRAPTRRIWVFRRVFARIECRR